VEHPRAMSVASTEIASREGTRLAVQQREIADNHRAWSESATSPVLSAGKQPHECGNFRRMRPETRNDLTGWRRGRDLNPRDPYTLSRRIASVSHGENHRRSGGYVCRHSLVSSLRYRVTTRFVFSGCSDEKNLAFFVVVLISRLFRQEDRFAACGYCQGAISNNGPATF
jgi:hypothetical protein